MNETILKLEEIQNDAVEAWFKAGKKGIVEMPTGSGKTHVGIKTVNALQRLEPDCHIVIVVMTDHLLKHWSEFLTNNNIRHGIVGGGISNIQSITVGIVNSVRNLDLGYFHYLIFDEAHHLVAPETIQIIENHKFLGILGLTSTIHRQDQRHNMFERYGLYTVYKQDLNNLISQNLLSSYRVYNIALYLNEKDQQLSNELDGIIERGNPKYGYNIQNAYELCRSGDKEACKYTRAIINRRKLLLNHPIKIEEVPKVVTMFPNSKAIIFTEYIKTAEAIRKVLQKNGIVGLIYHSEIETEEKNLMLNSFKEIPSSIMICCKALEEGLNVPDANLAISVGGNTTERQMRQRIGRILRFLLGKQAVLVELYFANTREEGWLHKRQQFLKISEENVLWI